MRRLSLIFLVTVLAALSGAPRATAGEDGPLHTQFRWPDAAHAHASSAFKVAALCQAYNFPKNLSGGGVIGILELGGGYTQRDLNKFSQLNGLPKIVVQDISVNGGKNRPGGSADAEVLLDIQVAAAAYYYATGKMPTIKVFFAPNSFGSFPAVINSAVQNNCDVLSISWGLYEQGWSSGSLQQAEAAAQTAAQNGLVIFAASGDNSANDGNTVLSVDGPASCPHVVGCGGTTKTNVAETVWGNGNPASQGTGGGFSVVFPQQAFQVGAPNGSGRMVPDVAADADPATGYLIVYHGRETAIGGTSAVSPLYSGLFAAFGKKLGFVTPSLWLNKSAFVDITQGSNGYSAQVGPDPCTGLGAPIGSALAGLLANNARSVELAVGNLRGGGHSADLALGDAAGPVSVLTGSGGGPAGTSLANGAFSAVVVDLKSTGIPFFANTPARVIGIGANGLNLFGFTGRE